jgi:hypothetical protein
MNMGTISRMEKLPDLAGLTHAEKGTLIHSLWDSVTALPLIYS